MMRAATTMTATMMPMSAPLDMMMAWRSAGPNDASARQAWDLATLEAVASVLPEVHAI